MAVSAIPLFEVPDNCRNRPPPGYKDILGHRFGRLVATGFKERSGHRSMWWVMCDCGTLTSVSQNALLKQTRSCGCLQREHVRRLGKSKVTHGMSHTRLDNVFYGMVARCYNPKSTSFNNYGGRGITVCQEWLEERSRFYEWSFANGYKRHMTIDRRDNNGNYEPSNCRWITGKQQQMNKRTNRKIEYEGIMYAMAELAEMFGLDGFQLGQRLDAGWDLQTSLTKPMGKQNRWKSAQKAA